MSNQKKNNEMQDAISTAIIFAKECGASQSQVSIDISNGYSVTARMGDVETIEHNNDRGVDITVYFGKKTGCASTTDLSKDSLRSAVEKACYIAQLANDDDCAGLADKEQIAFQYPELNLYYPWHLNTDGAIELAIECESIARNLDKKIINSEGVSIHNHEYQTLYGNSYDFIGEFSSSFHTIDGAVIASDGHEMQRDYDYTCSRDPHHLLDIQLLAKKIAQKTVNRLGAKKLSTRKCPVIFSAEIARGLIGHLMSAISGSSLYRNASFLINHLDKKVFADHINIAENPHLLGGLNSSPFDAEGVKTRANHFIDAGMLKNYVLSSYSARKLGMKTTGNAGGTHNLILTANTKPYEKLLKEMDTGLLVTELMGQGVSIVTGDYSRGAFGFWVEKGQIQYPVQEITIAGNLKDMFLSIITMGDDIDKRGNIQTGSLLIEQMTVAGQ